MGHIKPWFKGGLIAISVYLYLLSFGYILLKIFKESFGWALGSYILMIINTPGLIIIEPFFNSENLVLLYTVYFTTSLIFYFLFGIFIRLFIDKYKT
jgi:hypothetical protein